MLDPRFEKGRASHRVPQFLHGSRSVSNLRAVLTDNQNWLFTWDGAGLPYEVWLGGELLDTVSVNQYLFQEGTHPTSPPDLEIVNAGWDAWNKTHSPRIRLQWRGLLGAFFYKIDEHIDSTWVQVGLLRDSGQGYCTWTSQAHEDGDEPVYRVIAYSEDGSQGDPLPFTATVVRRPSPPTVECSISSSGDVTITAP